MKKGKNFRRYLMVSASLLVFSGLDGCYPAYAQEASGAEAPTPVVSKHDNLLDEVVVTASRKRNEDVQTTPVAVTALNADLLERAHVTNFVQLTNLVPNLQINHSSGSSFASVYLRGFGVNTNDPASEPHVAIFVDGIYQPDTSGDVFDTFNFDQVEVDAGPQGTLAGKNAPIGAVYITTSKPTGEFGGTVEADYGSYGQYGVRGKINVPLLKDVSGDSILAMNLALARKGGGNWVYNIANNKTDMGGVDDRIGRIGIAFTPTPEFSWDLSAFYSDNRDPQVGSRSTNYVPGVAGSSSNPVQTAPFPCFFQQNVPGYTAILNNKGCERLAYGTVDVADTDHEVENQFEVASTMNYKLDPVTLTLVTGFISFYQLDRSDSGGTPFVSVADYGDRTAYDQESGEFRVSSNKGGGWDLNGLIDWVVGGYFSNYNYSYSNHLGIGVAAPIPFVLPFFVPNDNQTETGTTQSEAFFLHTIFNFTDQWTGTFGVRQSWDQKNHAFQSAPGLPLVADIPAGFHNTSFEAGTAYQFDEQRMAYVRFAQGYQSGGVAGLALGNVFQPETNNAYEVGMKSDWLDKRLRVNLDFFLNELSNLQLASAVPIPVAPFFLQETLNAGSATIEGVEAQVIAVPFDGVTTHVNLGYLHPKFDQNNSTVCSNTAAPTDCSGNPFPKASKWTISVGGDYLRDLPDDLGTVTFSADWNYRSSLYTDDPAIPSSYQASYGLVNLSLTFRDPEEKYSVEFYGTNVFDQQYKTDFLDPGGIGSWTSDGRPAEWGIKLTGKF